LAIKTQSYDAAALQGATTNGSLISPEGDRPEILTIEPVLNVLKLAFEWIRKGGV
jgi:hypothetical protein